MTALDSSTDGMRSPANRRARRGVMPVSTELAELLGFEPYHVASSHTHQHNVTKQSDPKSTIKPTPLHSRDSLALIFE
jgi:hypothetical protein